MQALIVLYNAPLQMKRLTKPEYRFQLQLEKTLAGKQLPMTGANGKAFDGKFAQQFASLGGSASKRPPDDTRWEKMFGLLLSWGTLNEHCNVPKSEMYKGEALGLWLHEQKNRESSNSAKACLIPDRRAKLQKLVDTGQLRWANPGWTPADVEKMKEERKKKTPWKRIAAMLDKTIAACKSKWSTQKQLK